MGNIFAGSSQNRILPIDANFNFPSSMQQWPPGDGFASGYIDLGGGLQVAQVTSFNMVWRTYVGGPDNLGATIYEPSLIPDGFFMLGSYAQPNNQQLFGWVLVAKEDVIVSSDETGSILAKPIDYTLIWSSESSGGAGYVWLPTPPDGYKALGHIVTTTSEKPSLDRIRCVRFDYTDECETDNWIWGPGTESTESEGFNLYGLRPTNRGTQAQGVSVGTFLFQNDASTPISLACLKNNNFSSFSSMPNLAQVEAIVQAYSPFIYFHPDESYVPASANWYFGNGTLLYKQGDESNPVPIEPQGSNLPQGGSNDGTYWIDLPVDETERDRVKRGDLLTSQAYLHIKPMFGGTFTDVAMWIFYPFNGPSTVKLGLIDISLGVIGEHIGDWEHLTLRISNFNGWLYKVYFSQHSGGGWVDATLLEYREDGTNRVVAYSSLNGHAFYSKPGLVLQGIGEFGIRNDTAKSELVMDTGASFAIVSAGDSGYLSPEIVEPPWLNYLRKWGPKITYDIAEEFDKFANLLPGDLKTAFESLVEGLPDEIFGEDGPTGPKVKDSWNGDETES